MRLLGVEAARGIAALLVVLVHTTDILAEPRDFGRMPLAGLFRFGHAGVDFFFVLSGFIITYVHYGDIGHRNRLGGYAWKRFARIYPTYWVVTAILGAILVFFPTRERTEQHLSTIFMSLTLLPSLQLPILGVAWTLRHELLFYTVFAVLFLNRRLGMAVLALWGLLIGGNIATTWITGTPYFTGLADDLVFRIFNIEFFFGIAVAWLARARAPWRPHMLLVLGIVVFFGNGVLESWGPERPMEWPPRQLAYAVGAALTLYGLVDAERLGRLRVPAPLVTMGTASYSIYLLHIIVVMILQQIFRFIRPELPVPLELVFLCVVGVTIAVSVMFCRLVEQPLLRRFRRAPVLRAPAPMPRPPA